MALPIVSQVAILLIIGVVVGTAATIFIATPIAYDLMIRRAAKAGEEK